MDDIVTLKPRAAYVIHNILTWRLIFPIVLGAAFGLGDDVTVMEGRLYPGRPMLYGKMLLFAAFFCLSFILAERLIHILNEHESISKKVTFMFGWNTKAIGAGALGMAVCWLPYLILLYPGVYWSDTSRQLVMYYGGEPVMDQHPFLDTYLFGWFADLGQVIFANRIVGLYTLILIQAVIMIVLLSLTVSYLKRIGAPHWFCWLIYGIVSLFPLFPIMFSSLAKDTVNAIFVVPFMIMIAEIVHSEGTRLRSLRFVVLLAVDSLLMCMTKKTCVYIVIATLLILCIMKLGRMARLKLVGLAASITVIMFVLIPQFLFPALNIEPGGKQEMVPFVAQQLAHDLKYNGDSFSDADRKIIDGFFEYDSEAMGQRYEPFQADAVKGNFSRDESSLIDVLGLWLRKTTEHPIGHVEAWTAIAQGWISFRSKGGQPGYLVPYFSSNWFDERVIEYVQWPEETVLNHAVQTVYETVESVPIVNSLFFRGTWATVIPFFLCFMACGMPRREREKAWLMLVPLIASMATLFVAGVSGTGGEPTRYVFTSMVMIPIVFGFLLCEHQQIS